METPTSPVAAPGQAPSVTILGIGGSTRPGSSSEKALRLAVAAAAAAGAKTELITSRELILPIYDPLDSDRCERAVALIEAIKRADGVILASPGYHGSISGMVKNALDYTEDLREYERAYLQDLPVGCIAVAQGWQAAVCTLQALRATVHALRGWPSPLGAAVNQAEAAFADDGSTGDSAVAGQLETLGRQVTEFAQRWKAAQWAGGPAQPAVPALAVPAPGGEPGHPGGRG